MIVESKKKITAEQFEHIQNYDTKELYDFIENEAANSLFNPAGYGFLNPRLLVMNDEYFVTWQHYDSCD